MEQFIDEFGNIQFRETAPTTDFPFKSMTEMANENALAISNMFGVPQPLSSNPTFIAKQKVDPNFAGITTLNTPIQQSPISMFQRAGGQTFALNDPKAVEAANYFQRPVGIMQRAGTFLTQTLPETIKTGLETIVPGARFIQSFDKFSTLPYSDRKFISSTMRQAGLPNTGVFVDPSTGLIKDIRGKNVRSLMGNYAESIDQDYQDKLESINKSKQRWENKFGSLTNTNNLGKTWSEMNKKNIIDFNFLKNQKQIKDKQMRDTLDNVAAQVKAGVTAMRGQSLHGGATFKGSKKSSSRGPTGKDIHGGGGNQGGGFADNSNASAPGGSNEMGSS